MLYDEYYVKVGRKYVKAGYSRPDMGTGLYFHEEQKNGSRTTSVRYWVGSTSRPVDVERLVSLMRLDDKLAAYLGKICEANSDEFVKLREGSGGFIKESPVFLNISRQDLAVAILRFLYESEDYRPTVKSAKKEPK